MNDGPWGVISLEESSNVAVFVARYTEYSLSTK